jgi:hypothetical protein
MLIAVYAVYTAFGVSKLFSYSVGLSPDDAELAWQQSIDDVAMGILLPIDSIILFVLSAVVTALHVGARKSEIGATRMTKTGMVVTLGSFVLSLFKFSVFFPMLFSSIGYGASMAHSSPDRHAPSAYSSDLHAPSDKEYVLSDVELIGYTSDAKRVTASIKNTSSYDWESATVNFVLKDAAGKACYRADHEVKYIGKGQAAQLSTGRIETHMLTQPNCRATAVTMVVTQFDADSRSPKAPGNDAQPAPSFTSLKPLVEPDAIGNLGASVTGIVDGASTGRLNTGDLMFELVRADGVRLDMCFKPKVIAPDGSFITGRYHSPVGPGEITSAVFVPNCNGS